MAYFTKKGASVVSGATGGGAVHTGEKKKYSKVSTYVCIHDGTRAIVTLKNEVSHWYRESLIPFTTKKDSKVEFKEIVVGGQAIASYKDGVPIRTNRSEWVFPGGQHDKMPDDAQTKEVAIQKWNDETGCIISSNSSNNNLTLFGNVAESHSLYNRYVKNKPTI
jgi:hypothetical protein